MVDDDPLKRMRINRLMEDEKFQQIDENENVDFQYLEKVSNRMNEIKK